MPSSQPWRIPYIAELIYQSHPASILDVGIGFGKWGALAREYTDVNKGRCAKAQWKTRIDGIEIFPAYESVLWAVYDHIYIGDAANVLPTLGDYDLILAVEVLEHMPRAAGLKMIADIKAKSKQYVISYSNGIAPGMYGNKHEEHISKWTPEDFAGCIS